jgi:serine protease Do
MRLTMFLAALVAIVVASWSAQSAVADVIELTTGQKIEGEILKVQSDAVYVDVGVDIVRIPIDRIKSRTKSGSEADAAKAKPKDNDSNRIFTTVDQPTRTVKELTQQFGAGVVLVQTPGGLGSGFIINARGYCVTNYHVVEKETRVAVTIFDRNDRGEFRRRRIDDVKILALNPFFDLALLEIPKVQGTKFQPVTIAADDSNKEGDEVFAIGNPLGLERSVSQGIVSTRNRNVGGLVYIQTTAQINPGNSGGPLFNTRGQVVGVTNMKLTFGEGLGFAIPVSYLKHFLNNLEAFAFDKNNPNSGHRYLEPPRRRNPVQPYEVENSK